VLLRGDAAKKGAFCSSQNPGVDRRDGGGVTGTKVNVVVSTGIHVLLARRPDKSKEIVAKRAKKKRNIRLQGSGPVNHGPVQEKENGRNAARARKEKRRDVEKS